MQENEWQVLGTNAERKRQRNGRIEKMISEPVLVVLLAIAVLYAIGTQRNLSIVKRRLSAERAAHRRQMPDTYDGE